MLRPGVNPLSLNLGRPQHWIVRANLAFFAQSRNRTKRLAETGPNARRQGSSLMVRPWKEVERV